MLFVYALLYLLEGHAVFLGDICGVAHALRRRYADLEAALAVMHACYKALGAAVALYRLVKLAYRCGEVVHMRVEDGSRAEIAHGLHDVLRDKDALGYAGGGEALVQQQQAVPRGDAEYLRQPLAFFAQSSEVYGVVLISREVGVDVVARADGSLRRRDVQAPLSHQHGDTDSLCEDGLAAAVGAGEDVYAVLVGELEVVGDNVDAFAAGFVDSQLEVVYALKGAVALFAGQYLRLAERHTGRLYLFGQLSPADVEEYLGHQADQGVALDVHVSLDGALDVVAGLAHDVGHLLADGVR